MDDLNRDEIDILSGKAREVAHAHTKRCRGGERAGREGTRWHSASCDELADAIGVVLIVEINRDRKRNRK